MNTRDSTVGIQLGNPSPFLGPSIHTTKAQLSATEHDDQPPRIPKILVNNTSLPHRLPPPKANAILFPKVLAKGPFGIPKGPPLGLLGI